MATPLIVDIVLSSLPLYYVVMETIYILTRASGRPAGFFRLRESIKNLEWPGKIVHIVHSDDPRDTYIRGNCDILIEGETLQDVPVPGRSGPYNYYCNRMLDLVACLDPGWVHFIDDDDQYADAEVFLRMLKGAPRDAVLVGKVHRGGNIYYPKAWGTQSSFQTEIPMFWSEVALSGRWPLTKGGDHYYTKQLTDRYRTLWIEDVLIATTVAGKGKGRREDFSSGQTDTFHCEPLEGSVHVKERWRKDLRADLTRIPVDKLDSFLKQGWLPTFPDVRVSGIDIEVPFDRDLYDIIDRMKQDHIAFQRGTLPLGIHRIRANKARYLGQGRDKVLSSADRRRQHLTLP